MTRLKSILVLVLALAFALSPLVSPGFNGFSPDQFPVPQIDPPIQPEGWAFSIWGVIYAWLIASAFYGVIRHSESPDWDAARWPLILSLAVGAAWVPVANISPFWATVLIWIMWASAARALQQTPDTNTLWLRAPVALYTGWLTAASCVASAILVTGYGSAPVVPIHAAFVLLALSLAFFIRRQTRAPAFSLAVIWALFGITVANLDPLRPVMLIVALAGIVLLGVPAWKRFKRSL